ncbi:helix-turn-helix transcriptional regulator [Actinocrispum sp. NPDC049592]|uniref:helix-turn-helix domain-containing protein n=1 Tax=Actinocrispum sp. NPDC049592 TaxID=3154835 RepID=UPI003428682E
MRDRESTVRSRELGDALRTAMARSGLTAAEVARKLAWSQSRVSRLLSGKRGTGETSLAAVMAIIGITGPEFDRLLRVCREANSRGWLQHFGAGRPKQVRTLAAHEDSAVAITDFQQVHVPALLQTPLYARKMMTRLGSVPAAEIDERVETLRERQRLLSRAPQIRFTFYLHEFVLRLPVGGPATMSGQLHHLLRLSVRPSISLRVIPAAAGEHAAMSGAFTLMEFADVRPVVYVERETCGLFLEERPEIAAYAAILADLAAAALSEDASRELIGDIATELYPAGEDPAAGKAAVPSRLGDHH